MHIGTNTLNVMSVATAELKYACIKQHTTFCHMLVCDQTQAGDVDATA